MEKEYYIIGSGGFAKEIHFLAESTLDKSYFFRGFIDKNPSMDSIDVRGKEDKVLDEDYFLKKVAPSNHIVLFMGIGDPNLLTLLSNRFKDYRFPNLISSNAILDKKSVHMGKGNIITAGCIFTVDIQIGSFNVFNLGVTLGHDTSVGSHNILNPGSNISGHVKIGDSNLFGTNSTVLQNIEIGSNNILGAASLANKSFKNDQIMVGVPAKNIKK